MKFKSVNEVFDEIRKAKQIPIEIQKVLTKRQNEMLEMNLIGGLTWYAIAKKLGRSISYPYGERRQIYFRILESLVGGVA